MSDLDLELHCPECGGVLSYENYVLNPGRVVSCDNCKIAAEGRTDTEAYSRLANHTENKLTEGTKHDQDKIRTELFPLDVMLAISKVLTFGAKKYEDHNWKKGIKYTRLQGALLRHISAWANGEGLDPESKLPHLWHAGCCLTFLIYYEVHKDEYSDFDDRFFAQKPITPETLK